MSEILKNNKSKEIDNKKTKSNDEEKNKGKSFNNNIKIILQNSPSNSFSKKELNKENRISFNNVTNKENKIKRNGSLDFKGVIIN